MTRFKRSLVAVACSAALVAPLAAQATNGYFAHGYNIKAKGMAGAGAALPQDSLAAANNPAGMAFVGNRIDAGASIFSPHREYTDDDPTVGFVSGVAGRGQDSASQYFLIPHFGWSKQINSVSSFGISVYGNGGMNTDYEQPVFANTGGNTGVDLAQVFIAPTYARKFGSNNQHAFGITPIFAAQAFEATGLAAFRAFSTDPAKLSNNDHEVSTGFGAKFGVQFQASPAVTVGLAYETKKYMSEFDDYAGLFAEEGDFDIPATAILGIAWKPNQTSTVAVDVQHIRYSDVEAIANDLSPLFNNCTPGTAATGGSGAGCLGGNDGAGFGWDDMTVVKLGYQFQNGAGWTWRVGYSYGEQPIPDSEVLFNILAPGVVEQHLTFGFTKEIGKTQELDFSMTYAPEKEVSGRVDTTAIGGGVDNIDLKMHQFDFGFSYAWKF